MTDSNNVTLIQMSQLVTNLNKLGVDVPQDLLAEAKLRDEMNILDAKNHAARQQAMSDLASVPVGEFAKELEKAQTVWSETSQREKDGFADQVIEVRVRRLFGGIFDHQHTFFQGLADSMNRVIEAHRLNELELPENLVEFNVMSATPGDIEAINAFKSAKPVLDPMWNAYKSLGRMTGHEFKIDLNASETIETIYILGDITHETSYAVEPLREVLYATTQQTDGTKNIHVIAPWSVFNLFGIRLDIKTPIQASALRAKVHGSSSTRSNFGQVA